MCLTKSQTALRRYPGFYHIIIRLAHNQLHEHTFTTQLAQEGHSHSIDMTLSSFSSTLLVSFLNVPPPFGFHGKGHELFLASQPHHFFFIPDRINTRLGLVSHHHGMIQCHRHSEFIRGWILLRMVHQCCGGHHTERQHDRSCLS